MASRIRALNYYRPKIRLRRTADLEEVTEYIVRYTGLTAGDVIGVLTELRDAVIFFNRQGQGVKLEGLGTYLPTIGLDGTIGVSHRLDRYVQRKLNAPNAFSGRIDNKRNIGKSPDELVALWNVEHPDDPVTD